MSGFCIDQNMQFINQELKSMFQRNGLLNWKHITQNNFFDYSLASIFENICIMYHQYFEEFCMALVNHCPETCHFVQYLYEFLNSNRDYVLQGFPGQTEYYNCISQLSALINTRLNIKSPHNAFIRNHRFFTFFRVNLVILNNDGIQLTYKSFGPGKFKLYVYSEANIIYCLYHNQAEVDPFENFVNTSLPESYFHCQHPIYEINYSTGRCNCGRLLYREELALKQYQNNPIINQNPVEPYSQYNNIQTSGIPMVQNFHHFNNQLPEIQFNKNHQNLNQTNPHLNDQSSKSKDIFNMNTNQSTQKIMSPPQNMPLTIFIGAIDRNEENKTLNEIKQNNLNLQEFTPEKSYCKCKIPEIVKHFWVCKKCKLICYNQNFNLPIDLNQD